MAALRKKINVADKFYIDSHCLLMTAEEISDSIKLDYDSVVVYFEHAQQEQLAIAKEVETEARRKAETPYHSDNGVTVMTEAASHSGDAKAGVGEGESTGQQRPITPADTLAQRQGIWRG